MSYNDTIKAIYSDLRFAYHKGRNAYKEAAAAWEKEEKYYNDAVSEHNARRMTDRDFVIEQANHEKREIEHRQKMEDIKRETADSLANCRATLASYIDEYYLAQADKMDSRDMELLNTGIMKAGELDRLAGKYKDNTTMLRIIGKRAAEIEQNSPKDSDEARTAHKLALTIDALERNGGNSLAAFDALATLAIRGVSAEEGDVYTTAHAQYFEDAYNATINNLS